LNKHEAGGETLNGKKFTLFGVIAAAIAASAVYGLYRAGVIKNEHFTRPYNAVRQCIDDKLKIISEGHATPKARNRMSKK
jgi:hypothetical protein